MTYGVKTEFIGESHIQITKLLQEHDLWLVGEWIEVLVRNEKY